MLVGSVLLIEGRKQTFQVGVCLGTIIVKVSYLVNVVTCLTM